MTHEVLLQEFLGYVNSQGCHSDVNIFSKTVAYAETYSLLVRQREMHLFEGLRCAVWPGNTSAAELISSPEHPLDSVLEPV